MLLTKVLNLNHLGYACFKNNMTVGGPGAKSSCCPWGESVFSAQHPRWSLPLPRVSVQCTAPTLGRCPCGESVFSAQDPRWVAHKCL